MQITSLCPPIPHWNPPSASSMSLEKDPSTHRSSQLPRHYHLLAYHLLLYLCFTVCLALILVYPHNYYTKSLIFSSTVPRNTTLQARGTLGLVNSPTDGSGYQGGQAVVNSPGGSASGGLPALVPHYGQPTQPFIWTRSTTFFLVVILLSLSLALLLFR